MRSLLAAPLALLLIATGCASTSGTRNPKDPWEGYNRPMHEINEQLDRAVLKPVAQGYVKVIPEFARAGVSNFFGNLNDVGTGVNNFLQGKPREGATDLGRFAFNSVVGIFGLWDVASAAGLDKHNEDFGQTLGVWGMPSGPYFVIPLLGPSSARDAPARLVDPQYATGRWIDDAAVSWAMFGLDVVNMRAYLLQSEKILDEAALDRYSFIRDAWLQRRRSQVYDGNPPKDKDDE
jgi:phospholipid-binding lipoprotein MlaA